ncbi:MAG: hypothetical protein P4L99_10160 [Chthoniobacter sp.]|nr:hypothetical protein [Chthoniobacter sp.]
MKRYPLSILGSIVLTIGLTSGMGRAADPAEEQLLNNGEDFTKPVNRFDTRFQFESQPDATQSGRLFTDRHAQTMTFRTDLVFFRKPDQLALRFDLPLEWSNKPTSENSDGFTRFGMGDLLAQAAYIHTFEGRWAAGVGLQMILPTATAEAFGNGKWQLAPTVGVRAALPEVSAGSYVGMLVRQFVSVAGPASRSDINYLSLEPQFNLTLPRQWYLNTSPKLRYNFEKNQWFVPLDIMVGRKFGLHWVASVEYQYGLVRDDPRYNQWLEARVGYFF